MKENYTITEMPYLTRNEMIEIADDGVEWAYNRQLCSNKIRQLPYDPEIVYPVEEHFYHEHRWHQASETTMRLVIMIPGSFVTADVPLSYFESLPKAHYLKCNDEIVAVLLNKADGSPWRLRFQKMNLDTRCAIRHLIRESKDHRTTTFLETYASSIC